MGCGASANPPASDAEKMEMMGWALKEMMIDIGTTAITNGDKVQVKAPIDQCGTLRDSVGKIKAAGAAAKEKMSGAGGAEDAAAKAANAGGALGGMMGGAMKAAGGMMDKGLAAAGGAAGSAAEAALNALADTIQKGINELDGKFAAVGQEVAKAKVDDIIVAYKSAINDRAIENPQVYVRGAPPHGPDQASACPKDKASAYITETARSDLVDKFMPVCKEAVDNCSACKAWKSLIGAYNDAQEQIGKIPEVGEKMKGEPITLDIERYIVDQIVLGYRTLMAEKEAANRANPKSVTVPKNSTTFERCWNIGGGGIPYADFKQSHFQDFKFNNV